MAYPVVAAVNGGNNTSNSTSHTVNLPSGISAGHLLLVFFSADGTPTITFPAGWNELFQTSGSTCKVGAWYRIADGGEGATITVSTSASEESAHTSYRLTSTNVFHIQAGTPATGADDSPNPPSFTPVYGAKDYVWFAVCGNDKGAVTVSSYPTDYTNGRNDVAGNANGCGVGSAYRELNASTDDPGVFTLSGSEEWVANTIVISNAEIDVGSAATDRSGTAYVYYTTIGADHYTLIDYNNAANDTGSIDTVEVWFNSAHANHRVRAGTFTDNGSNSFTCRDAEALGAVNSGSKTTFTGLDMEINSGEFLGIDNTDSQDTNLALERDASGGGYYYYVGQVCVPTSTYSHTFTADRILSLYATGETAGPVEKTGTDAVVGVDASLLSKLYAWIASDTGGGAEASLLAQILAKVASDAVAGAEALTGIKAELSPVDLGAGVDALSYLEWKYSIPLTIDHNQIDADLTDFPVMVNLSASSGISTKDVSAVFDELGANRKKIAVTLADGLTQCYVEIEKWDEANEVAWLHIKVPDISSTVDTTLYLYYDADHADNDTYVGDTNSTPAENAWDSNGKFVTHGADGVDNAHVYDSTSNNNDGEKTAANNPNQVAGDIGYAQAFDGSDDIDCGVSDILNFGNTAPFTIEAVFKTLAVTRNELVSRIATGGLYPGFTLNISRTTAGKIDFYTGNYATNFGAGLNDNVRHYVAAVCHGNGNVTVYIDGGAGDARVLAQNTNISGARCFLGLTSTLGSPLTGQLDEVRISDIARSAAWIKATKESLWDNLITFGDVGERAVPLTVLSSLSETGSLAEAVLLLYDILSNDSITSLDTLTSLLNELTPVDSGTATDESFNRAIEALEVVAGSEAVSYFANAILSSDDATVIDSLMGLAATLASSDSGVGVDSYYRLEINRLLRVLSWILTALYIRSKLQAGLNISSKMDKGLKLNSKMEKH